MPSKIKIILLSDLHLENKSPDAIIFVLNSINEKVEREKAEGNTPVVILAGDVNNDTNGYEWMKAINTQVLYIAGNHEYWGGDFYEINESLINDQPANVEYLYNRAFTIEDTIFLGSTLWTDVAEKTNPDISPHCAFTMNDSVYITAKKWYEKSENIEKLAKITSRIDEFSKNKTWNILVEREENKKTQQFYEGFYTIYNFFKSYIYFEEQHLEYSFNYSKEIFKDKTIEQKKIDLYAFKNDISLKEYLKLNNNFEREFGNTYIKNILGDNPFLEELFQQFKNEDLKSKKIVVISHHLPFMEEISIGHHRSFKRSSESQLPNLLNSVDERVFLINEGTEYPYHNYFLNCSKGKISKDKDITKIAHYCNSGSKMFNESFLKNIDLWVHGHEHSYNFVDYLKGIKIATNPMGYALNRFKFENGKPAINDEFKNDEEKEEMFLVAVENLKKEFMQEVVLDDKTNNNSRSSSKSEVWSWVLWNRENHLNINKKALYLNKKLSTLIAKKIQGQKYDQFQINTYALAFNSLVDSLTESEKTLTKAIKVRGDLKYSYQNESFGLTREEYISKFTINMISRDVVKLNEYYLNSEFDFNPFNSKKTINSYGLKELFFNSVHLTYANKKVTQINSLLQKQDILSSQDINQKLIDEFDKIETNMGFDKVYKLEKKVETRFNALITRLKNNNSKAIDIEQEDVKKLTIGL